MRVLIIAEYFPPDLGGASTRAFNAARGLIMNDCQVTVVTAFPHYPEGKVPAEYRWKLLHFEANGPIRIIRTAILPLRSMGLINRIILFLNFVVSSLIALSSVDRPDAVLAMNPNVVSMIPSLVYGTVNHAPVLMNVDDLWPEELYNLSLIGEGSILSLLFEKVASFAYRHAKAIFSISPAYIALISRKYKVDRRKFHVIRSGVDTDIFRPIASPSEHHEFKVTYSGAFSVAYDFDYVFQAAKLLQGRKSVKFVVQGSGELGPHMKSELEALGLTNIRIIDKSLTRQEVSVLLQSSDALLLPLRDFGRPYLGISSKLYEYQAVGKPILCCAEGEPAEFVRQTASGLVSKPGDSSALVRNIIRLSSDAALVQGLAKAGLDSVRSLSIAGIGAQLRGVILASSSNMHDASSEGGQRPGTSGERV